MKYIKTYEENIDKSQITELNLYGKNLTELPNLSEYINLKKLYCNNNKLTSLPELPNSLLRLDCDNNNLASLPELPKSLEYLYCHNNNLPYNNLEEYKEWKLDPETYEAKKTGEKYNI